MNFNSQKGLIASVPMYINRHPDAASHVSKPFAKFELFPNPVSEDLHISFDMEHSAKSVTYTVLNSMGHVINKTKHTNVQNDAFTFNTAGLPVGHYFMVVNADGNTMFKKFTVLH